MLNHSNEASSSTNSKISITPSRGSLSGRKLGVKFYVCPSPTCRCSDVRVSLRDESNTDLGDFVADVFTREIVQDTQGISHELDLQTAHEIAAEFDSGDWDFLSKHFYSEKRLATDNLDPATTGTHFRMHEIEMQAELVAFEDILPFGERLEAQVGERNYWMDDSYCLQSECDCSNAVMAFVDLNDRRLKMGILGDPPALQLDYRTGKYKVETHGDTNQNPAEIYPHFEKKYPDLLSKLAKRQKILSALYSEYRKSLPVQTPAVSTKVGRNESCPCGSGKKFKKCCG